VIAPRRPLRLLFALACASALAAGLSGCGRRGPLELPPEVQERGKFLDAQEAAKAKPAPLAPGAARPKSVARPIPGTQGYRPPAEHPFPLDPLL